ncbi:MAG: RdgB/HAM1 family non-canonical purine NTP pyrophosphatase [Candidatus Brocadiia bacterium]
MSPPTLQTIVLGSRNPGKLRELREALGDLPVDLRRLDDCRQAQMPQEDGTTFAQNARKKALGLAGQLDTWVVADDSGLCVDALGGRPGVRSARYAQPDATDAQNLQRLLEELADVEDAKRDAKFVCALALASPQGLLFETQRSCKGRITRHPRGHNGFGYDPLFLYPPYGATFAEVSPEAKNQVSHRGKALRALAQRLPELLEARHEEDP